MVVPNTKDGYTLFSIDTSEISSYTSKLLFQHHSKKFHYLADRLVVAIPELQDIFSFISGISESWVVRLKGQIVNFCMRVLTVYADNPQRYGYYGDFIIASNYSKLKHHIQKIIKVLIIKHGLPSKYYKLHIPKDRLIKLSKLFANDLLPLANKLLPKYRKLTQNS